MSEFTARRAEAEREIAPFLPANPRTAKRLLNHVRVYAMIAEDRRVFGGTPELTHRHLAKWVLLSEVAPRLAAALTRNPQEMGQVEAARDRSDLQAAVDRFATGVRVNKELLDLLRGGVPLAPVLARLVTFEPSAQAEALQG